MVKLIKSIINFIIISILVYISITFVMENFLIYYFLAFVLFIYILGSEREYYSKLIWLMCLAAFPVIGIVLYIAFGEKSSSTSVYGKKVLTNKEFDIFETHKEIDIKDNDNLKIMKNLGKRAMYENTDIEILYDGQRKFSALLKDIDEATDYIHILYYIIKESDITDVIFERLKQKAKEGVEVRILYDAVGSKELTKLGLKNIKDYNIKMHPFGNYRLPILNSTINFRNHRKIVIIDGKVGYLGGINISDEYIGYSKKYGYWRDMHMKLVGEVVRELQLSFARDWYFTTKENFIACDYNKYMTFKEGSNNDENVIQIINNGADYKDVSTRDIYFKLIASAKKQITIITPYFIPDYETLKAITTAAENNVDVRLFTPGIPDQKPVHAITRTYYYKLLKSGVRIFEANDSFLHAKALMIDDDLFTLGTSNIDYRSFNINFEVTAFVKSETKCREMYMYRDFYQATSTEITLDKWEKRPVINKYMANILQLIAPIF